MTGLKQVLLTGSLMLGSMAFVPGCASNNWPDDVPHTASLNSEGNGRLAFTAPSSGTVYVYDDSSNRLVYSGQVLSGQRIVVDPKNDRVDLDDRRVSNQSMGTEDRYQVYFDSQSPRVVERRVIERRTVDEPVVTERHDVVEEHVTPAPGPGVTERHTVEEHRVERVQ
jgi:hypothetical protein